MRREDDFSFQNLNNLFDRGCQLQKDSQHEKALKIFDKILECPKKKWAVRSQLRMILAQTIVRMFPSLFHRSPPPVKRIISLAERGIEHSQNLKNFEFEQTCYYNRGCAQQIKLNNQIVEAENLVDPIEIRDVFNKAEEFGLKIPKDFDRVKQLGQSIIGENRSMKEYVEKMHFRATIELGSVYTTLAKIDSDYNKQAIKFYSQVMEGCLPTDKELQMLREPCIYNLGEIYLSQRDFQKAKFYFMEEIKLKEESYQFKEAARTKISVASCFQGLKEYSKAKQALKKGIEYLNRAKDLDEKEKLEEIDEFKGYLLELEEAEKEHERFNKMIKPLSSVGEDMYVDLKKLDIPSLERIFKLANSTYNADKLIEVIKESFKKDIKPNSGPSFMKNSNLRLINYGYQLFRLPLTEEELPAMPENDISASICRLEDFLYAKIGLPLDGVDRPHFASLKLEENEILPEKAKNPNSSETIKNSYSLKNPPPTKPEPTYPIRMVWPQREKEADLEDFQDFKEKEHKSERVPYYLSCLHALLLVLEGDSIRKKYRPYSLRLYLSLLAHWQYFQQPKEFIEGLTEFASVVDDIFTTFNSNRSDPNSQRPRPQNYLATPLVVVLFYQKAIKMAQQSSNIPMLSTCLVNLEIIYNRYKDPMARSCKEEIDKWAHHRDPKKLDLDKIVKPNRNQVVLPTIKNPGDHLPKPTPKSTTTNPIEEEETSPDFPNEFTSRPDKPKSTSFRRPPNQPKNKPLADNFSLPRISSSHQALTDQARESSVCKYVPWEMYFKQDELFFHDISMFHTFESTKVSLEGKGLNDTMLAGFLALVFKKVDAENPTTSPGVSSLCLASNNLSLALPSHPLLSSGSRKRLLSNLISLDLRRNPLQVGEGLYMLARVLAEHKKIQDLLLGGILPGKELQYLSITLETCLNIPTLKNLCFGGSLIVGIKGMDLQRNPSLQSLDLSVNQIDPGHLMFIIGVSFLLYPNLTKIGLSSQRLNQPSVLEVSPQIFQELEDTYRKLFAQKENQKIQLENNPNLVDEENEKEIWDNFQPEKRESKTEELDFSLPKESLSRELEMDNSTDFMKSVMNLDSKIKTREYGPTPGEMIFFRALKRCKYIESEFSICDLDKVFVKKFYQLTQDS